MHKKYLCLFLTYHLFHQHFPGSIEWDVIAFLYIHLVVVQTENFHQSLCLSANKGDEGQQANTSADFLLEYISILNFIWEKKKVSFVHKILNYFSQKISEQICCLWSTAGRQEGSPPGIPQLMVSMLLCQTNKTVPVSAWESHEFQGELSAAWNTAAVLMQLWYNWDNTWCDSASRPSLCHSISNSCKSAGKPGKSATKKGQQAVLYQ